jgi:hypothetical protein
MEPLFVDCGGKPSAGDVVSEKCCVVFSQQCMELHNGLKFAAVHLKELLFYTKTCKSMQFRC